MRFARSLDLLIDYYYLSFLPTPLLGVLCVVYILDEDLLGALLWILDVLIDTS